MEISEINFKKNRQNTRTTYDSFEKKNSITRQHRERQIDNLSNADMTRKSEKWIYMQ